MDKSVNAILAAIDDFRREAGTKTYRALAGLEAEPSKVELFAPLAEATHAETIQFISELSENPRIDALKKARLGRLLASLLSLSVQSRLAHSEDAVTQVLLSSFEAGSQSWTLAETLSDGWAIDTHEERATVSKEFAAALQRNRAVFERRVDAVTQAATQLKWTGGRALVEASERRTFSSYERRAHEALARGDDAARDLTAYALKRLDAQLKPSGASALDLTRALAAPWFFEWLKREDLAHAVSRTFGELGFTSNALGKILIDSESPSRRSGAHVIHLEVPDQLRLVLTAAPGFDGYGAWLSAWGEAQFAAAIPKTLAFIDRVIGDSTLIFLARRLFESLLLDEQWLKRAVKVTASQARELARAFAWRQLMQLRDELALVSVRRELLERGAVSTVTEAYCSAVERARFIEPNPNRFLLEVPPLSASLTSLDAWALEAGLIRVLRERFNEDWWRNPATGRFLVGLMSRGVADDASQVAAQAGCGPLDLTDAVSRRVVIMGA